MRDISRIFKKAGFKPKVCAQSVELTPQEIERIKETDEAVKNYLKKIKQAYEASKHSKLRFDAPVKIMTRKPEMKRFSNQKQHQ